MSTTIGSSVSDALARVRRCDTPDAARVLDGIVSAMERHLDSGEAYKASVLAEAINTAYAALWVPASPVQAEAR